MRFLALLLLVVLIATVADARGRRKNTPRPPRPPTTPATDCRGKPRDQDCIGGRDEGHSGRECERNANNRMWYYNHASRQCIEMKYLGCGGNRNRYCSKGDCEIKCRR